MTYASKIMIETGSKPRKISVSAISPGTAFTGRLVGLCGSPYSGLFLKQGRELVGLSVTNDKGNKLGETEWDRPGNVFFDITEGTVEDFQEVDLIIKAVPYVS